MRTHLADHTILVPSSVEEALRQQADHERLIPVAGGTDVLVWMNAGNLPPVPYQSLHRLAREWRYTRVADGGVLHIGALATYSDVRRHAHVAAHFPMLVESARVTGALQIQNRGTIAGNIANASPAADTVPALLAYGAELLLVSTAGERRVPLDGFHTGYKKNVLRHGELIAEIIVPMCTVPAARQHYRKVGTREAQAISKVVFAGVRDPAATRMAWGSVAPVTLRSKRTEEIVARGGTFDEAWAALQAEISPIDDIRSTRRYRLAVSRNILREFMGMG